MAWFWTIIQLLIRLSAFLLSCDIKMLHGIWYKVGGLNQQISYSNLPQVISKVFKSYRIAYRVALWLDFEQLSSYLFVYWLLFVFTAEKYYLEFQLKLKVWINKYLIETWHRLFQVCFKSYRIAFRKALWLDFGQLSSYLFVYRRLFRVTISKCYMEFDTNWRIEWRDILFKLTTGYLKSISSHIE